MLPEQGNSFNIWHRLGVECIPNFFPHVSFSKRRKWSKETFHVEIFWLWFYCSFGKGRSFSYPSAYQKVGCPLLFCHLDGQGIICFMFLIQSHPFLDKLQANFSCRSYQPLKEAMYSKAPALCWLIQPAILFLESSVKLLWLLVFDRHHILLFQKKI